MLSKINVSIILIIMVFISGCKSIEIFEVKKQFVLSGYKNGENKIKYSATIKSIKSFTIKKIKIDKVNEEISTFSIIELPSGKLITNSKDVLPGAYFVEVSVSENRINKESIDTLIISIVVNNKEKEFKKKTSLISNLLGR
jgi:hypothetical protein